VYFCCLEALQNRAKHAPSACGHVELAVEDGWLTFAVSDDGPGFDSQQARAGSGLQNMADRMAAVGGKLEVRSEPGRGTTVAGRVPARPRS
jgi:signal transduction histidine kinase